MRVAFLPLAWQNGSAVKKQNFKQKITIFLTSLILISACTKSSPSGERSSVIIGLQPNEKSSDHQAFSKDLSDRVGIDINIVISKDYDDLVQRFKDGSIDFAFFSPLNFLAAERSSDAKVLLKKVYGNSEFYHSAIIVRDDSPIKTLADLQGKKLAFVDLKSTSGYLYPKVLLRKAGVDLAKVEAEFLGTHDAAVQALLNNSVVAAGIWADTPEKKSGAWTTLAEQKKVKVRVLQYSDPIPNDAFVVRNAFFVKRQEDVFKIMNALIDMSEKGVNTLKKAFDTDKMSTATSRHYDSVREVEKEMETQ
jgi:phosphonate transport system substrate-binding protein